MDNIAWKVSKYGPKITPYLDTSRSVSLKNDFEGLQTKPP